MDEVTRSALTSRVERHHPSPIWAWLRVSRCAVCRLRWPCPNYRDALRTLRISSRPNAVTDPVPLQKIWPLNRPRGFGRRWI
jgi:hypothetical protein